MESELKNQWAERLESEQIKQTRGKLRRKLRSGDYGYCCLGVLGVCLGGEWVEKEGLRIDGRNVSQYSTFKDDLLKRIGLTSTQQNTLVSMNDLQKKNFKEIAAYIRENL